MDIDAAARQSVGVSQTAPRLLVRDLHSEISGPFSFEVAAGSCTVVTGASGSGKSLLLRMLADLDPCHGAVELDGRARSSFAPADWRSRVTYVAADAGWWSESVAEHFPAARREAAAELAVALGLEAELLQAPVARLSTGERQRLALIRALVEPRAVLLLDEPTGPLDAGATARVEGLLRERLADGGAMVLVTHDEGLAERLGQQRFRMHERKFAAP